MTYNICSGGDFTNYDPQSGKFPMNLTAAAEAIRRYNPDIVGLNEVRGEGPHPDYPEQAKILGETLGMYYYFGRSIFFEGNLPYGNALLSRFPILDAEVIGIPDPVVKDEPEYYETRSILKARLDCREPLTVLVSHFGLNRGERENAVTTLCALLRDISGPCVFVGDLNMEPDDPLLSPIFSLLSDTAQTSGSPLLTFSSWEPEMKIDYIFVSKSIKTLEAVSLDEKASDHRPYLAMVETSTS